MATSLPFPVRIAAGVLATGLDRLRRLPQDLPALSVTVAGQAARLSMRVQQEITALAGRGDEMLSGITSRPTEHPAWATFDDEGADSDASADAGSRPAADADPATTTDVDPAARPHRTVDPSPAAARSTTPRPATPDPATPDPTTPDPTTPGPDASGPADMPGYDTLRVTQVRARLHALDADAVARLLEYERTHAARAAFVTLLGNRIAMLRAGAPGGTQA